VLVTGGADFSAHSGADDETERGMQGAFGFQLRAAPKFLFYFVDQFVAFVTS